MSLGGEWKERDARATNRSKMHSIRSRSSEEVDRVEGGSEDEEDGEKNSLQREHM